MASTACGFPCYRGSNAACDRSMATTRKIDAPEIKFLEALPDSRGVLDLYLVGGQQVAAGKTPVVELQLRNLLPRISFGVSAQVMYGRPY